MKRPLLAAMLLLLAAAICRLLLQKEFDPGGLLGCPGLIENERVYVSGQICRIDDNTLRIQAISFIRPIRESIPNDGLSSGKPPIPKTYKIEIETTEDVSKYRIGMEVTAEGTFLLYNAATNPGEFDTAAYYRSLGVLGRLTEASVREYGETYSYWQDSAYRLRLFLEKRINRLYPGRAGDILCALLLGDKSGLGREVKDLYARNGILHILSISSLHITLIGMSLYQLLRRMGVPILPAALAGSLILLFYGCMTGFSVSAIRAIGMYLLRMAAQVLGRTYDMLTALGILAAGMVLVRPEYIYNGGFLLSFSAVAGVGVIYPILKPEKNKRLLESCRRKWLKRVLRYLLGVRESFLAGLSISLGTLPIQLWLYFEVPVLSVGINLFVLPFVGPLLLCGMLSLLPGAGILALADKGILLYYDRLLQFADGFAYRTWNPGQPYAWQIVLYYLLLAVGLAAVKHVRENGKKSGAGWLLRCACVSAVLVLAVPKVNRNAVYFLDVGQGNCILLLHETGEVYLYDCGSSSRRGIGRNVLLPCLKSLGIDRIDAVMVSHPDADHMNGVTELLGSLADNHMTVGQLILPAIEKQFREEDFAGLYAAAESAAENEKEIRTAYLQTGDSWQIGSATYTCLHPGYGYFNEDRNAYSLCLLVQYDNAELLLTGDAAGEGEEQLIRSLRQFRRGLAAKKQLTETDNEDKRRVSTLPLVLQVSHHGSGYTTSEEFLKEAKPAAAIISVGRNNSYDHPHYLTLERLENSGAKIFRTDRQGAILFLPDRQAVSEVR